MMEDKKQKQGEPLIWSTTQGGAYACGEYLVSQRVDGKGWNALGEHKQLLLGASLEDCKSICERDAVESLAKQEQGEPVAWGFQNSALTGSNRWMMLCEDIPTDDQYGGALWTPLFTLPPQRTWVGLTDEELSILGEKFTHPDEGIDEVNFGMEIQRILKEKNTWPT